MRRPRHREMRDRVRELVIITILAWATHTLLSQWGHGAEPAPEKFVPAGGVAYRVASLEIRSETTVSGPEVKLSQIARWPEGDDAALGRTAELVIARFEPGQRTVKIELPALCRTLEDAGVNLASINFSGAMACRVNRPDARLEAALEQAVDAHVKASARKPAQTPTERPAGTDAPLLMINNRDVPAKQEPGGPRALRDLLLADLARRFKLPAEAFQLHFGATDEKLANLAEPMFAFDISPRRERNLGYVTWDLLISTPAGAKQKTSVTADVRAWQNVLVANRAIVTKQQFRDEDVLEKKLLLDYLVEDNALSKAQVVGQQAGRDIATGTIITTRMVEATILARVGQLVNVTIEQGQVKLKWVAEAREGGSYGQTIRVRKPGTREEYHVTLTGPQEGRLTGGAPPAADVAAAAR